MGVEYEHYLVPTSPTFRPSAERIARFGALLVERGCVPAPGSKAFAAMRLHGDDAKTGATFESSKGSGAAPKKITPAWLRAQKPDVVVAWSVGRPFDVGLPYPLTRRPYVEEGAYFEYQVRWSRHFIATVGENVEGGATPTCACGASFARPRPKGRLPPISPTYFTKCPVCRAPLDSSRYAATVIDDQGRGTRIGLARFQIVIDCGKAIPEYGESRLSVQGDFRAMCEDHFGCVFRDAGVTS